MYIEKSPNSYPHYRLPKRPSLPQKGVITYIFLLGSRFIYITRPASPQPLDLRPGIMIIHHNKVPKAVPEEMTLAHDARLLFDCNKASPSPIPQSGSGRDCRDRSRVSLLRRYPCTLFVLSKFSTRLT